MQEIALRIACVAIGYLFGMFQTAYFYGKAKGIDIREHGSGNAGTTNTLRVLGKKAGIIVLLGDVLKTSLAILVVDVLFVFGKRPEMRLLLSLYAGAGAVIGHDYPFYIKFRGGKGIASTAGIVIATDYRFLIAAIISFFVPYGITSYVSLGSLTFYLVFFIQVVVCGQMGWAGMDVISQGNLIEIYIILGILTAMAYYKHRANIVRLLKGEERKTHILKKDK